MPPVAEFYEKNKGLVHAVSRKGYARLQSAGVGLDYEDVFQEMSIVFLKAYEGFDASKGFKFTTYYYMAAFNKLNNWAQKQISERLTYGVLSVEEMDDRAGGDSDVENVMMVDPSSPESYYKCKEFLIHVSKTLSPLVGLILNWTLTPPPELLEQLRMAEYHAEFGRSIGISSRNMATLSPRYVGSFLVMVAGACPSHVNEAIKEIALLEKVDTERYL